MIACPWCEYSHPKHLTSSHCLKCGASFETLYLCPNNSCPMHRQFQAANKECQSCGRRLLGEFSGRNITWGNAIYRVREFIGGGGMGEVYRGIEQDQSGTYSREVAIKFNKNMVDPEIVKRFQREVQVLNMLQNPHNIRVFTYGELYEERPTGMEIRAQFMVMELLEGITLNELVKKYGPLPPREAVALFIQVCSALSEAHQKGVIHRDIKPHNIMLQELGGDRFAKVFDFGLSRITHSLDAKISTSGVVMGTFRYMSPEQALGEDVDHRTDIFSLGVVLYEVLSGRHPFPAKNLFDLFNLHQKGPPPLKEVPPELEAIVKKTLAYEKSRRYQSVEDLRKDLELWQKTGTSKAFEESSPSIKLPPERGKTAEGEKVRSSKVKNPALFIGVSALLVLVLLLGGYGLFSSLSGNKKSSQVDKQESVVAKKSKDSTVLARGGNIPSPGSKETDHSPPRQETPKREKLEEKGREDTETNSNAVLDKKEKNTRKVRRKRTARKKKRARLKRDLHRRDRSKRWRTRGGFPSEDSESTGKKSAPLPPPTGGPVLERGAVADNRGGGSSAGPIPPPRRLDTPRITPPPPREKIVRPTPPPPKPKKIEKPQPPPCPRESPTITYRQLDRSLGQRLTPRTSRVINRAASSTVYDAGLNLSQSWVRASVLCKKPHLCPKILRLVQYYCRSYRPYRHCTGYRALKVCRGGKCLFKCKRE